MVYVLEPLPYAYNALEPYFDEQTMKLHHDKHHQTYVDKLNAALEVHKDLQNKKVEDLLKDLNKIPESSKTAVKNHGGGHFNHSFWWPMLKKDVQISGDIQKNINASFGNFEDFKKKFTDSALGLFGSGWTWLVFSNGKLEIINTPNQDCPITLGKVPVLGVDMWEHSMYLRYNNRKGEYLGAFFKVINWDKVNEHLKHAMK
ncbi:superoxide dismutase [Candidatus Woesearchaeota archaeon]|nr:superoxide dismutase [Candidatus Woesearchaeota archaeon]